MNRFRSKKKVNEAAAASTPDLSRHDDAPPMPSLKSTKTFRLGSRKNTKEEPEAKVELDLSTALPSTDDFRTSLLMSGLSARFSMLREADDPNSKMGKASDDSVIFSSRHSRLDFNFQPKGLTDIAEVQSIRSTIRAPFSHNGNAASRTSLDGYGTDDDSMHTGSIMSRAKPGEGNNLFGGRQKVYKIPTKASSTKNLGESGGSGMGGRVLYDDDVSKSAFQKLRERERQQRQEELEAQEQLEQSPRADSPPLSGYNRNRETSSTTSSGPLNARSSTAATSVTSQGRSSENGSNFANTPAVPGGAGMERTLTKGRRLYETGLDQHLHDQQHSAMSRIDSLTRQRTFGASTPPLSLSTPTSMTGMHEKYERFAGRSQNDQITSQIASPPPTAAALGAFDFGVKPLLAEPQRKPSLIGLSPPLSPPMSDADDHSSLQIQPNDHGKATAMGAFQKPSQPYDDKKWSQRQMQLQQDRETPPPRRNAPPTAFMPAKLTTRTDTSSSQDTASVRSGSAASVHREPTSPLARMIDQPVKEVVSESEVPAVDMGAFLASPDPSSIGSPDPGNDGTSQPWGQPLPPASSNAPTYGLPTIPIQGTNLASRPQQPQPINTEIPEKKSMSDMSGFSFQSQNRAPSPIAAGESSPIDSPTLGPVSGLSGMVRRHMRSDSEASSSFGTPSPEFTKNFSVGPLESIPQYTSPQKSENSWDVNDWDQNTDPNTPYETPTISREASEPVAQTPLAPISGNAEQPVQTEKPAWEKELESKHSRTASTDTQQERQDFAAELAARRKRVQENMKTMAAVESRSTSPVPNLDWSKETSRLRSNPLGILKAKASGESLVSRAKENLSKATGNAQITAPIVANKVQHDDNQWQKEEEEMLRGIVKGPKVPGGPTKSFREQRRDAQRERERQIADRHRDTALKLDRGGQTPTSPSFPPQQDPRQQPNGRGPVTRPRAPSQASSFEGSGYASRPSPENRGPPISQPPVFKPRDPSRERRPSVQTQAFPAYSESPEPRHPGPPPAMSTQRRPSATPYQSRAPSRTDTYGSQGTPQQSRPGSRTARDRSESNEIASRPGSRTARYRDEPSHVLSEVNGILTTGAYENMAPARMPVRMQAAPILAPQPESDASPPPGVSTGRARSASKSKPGYFDVQKLAPIQTEHMEIGLSPRPSPVTPYSANTTPSLPSPNGASTTPTGNAFQAQRESQREKAARKKSINKWDISEPTLMSATSRIDTVDLPPGASLKNGAETAPPVPPINPRRRQTRTATIFGSVFHGKGPGDEPMPPTPTLQQFPDEEYSTFSADEADSKPSKPRQKLRKISSEGGNLSGRNLASQHPAPSMYSSRDPSPPAPVEGAMF